METLLITIVVMSLVLFAVLTLTQTLFASQEALAECWREATAKARADLDTDITLLEATAQGTIVELVLSNSGDTRLADFDRWDLIVQYYALPASYQVTWVPHQEIATGGIKWEVVGLYLDAAQATPEIYEPGVLNPGEEMVIRASVNPAVDDTSSGMVTIITCNGAVCSGLLQSSS